MTRITVIVMFMFILSQSRHSKTILPYTIVNNDCKEIPYDPCVSRRGHKFADIRREQGRNRPAEGHDFHMAVDASAEAESLDGDIPDAAEEDIPGVVRHGLAADNPVGGRVLAQEADIPGTDCVGLAGTILVDASAVLLGRCKTTRFLLHVDEAEHSHTGYLPGTAHSQRACMEEELDGTSRIE
jgi:hypothetical protein